MFVHSIHKLKSDFMLTKQDFIEMNMFETYTAVKVFYVNDNRSYVHNLSSFEN